MKYNVFDYIHFVFILTTFGTLFVSHMLIKHIRDRILKENPQFTKSELEQYAPGIRIIFGEKSCSNKLIEDKVMVTLLGQWLFFLQYKTWPYLVFACTAVGMLLLIALHRFVNY